MLLAATKEDRPQRGGRTLIFIFIFWFITTAHKAWVDLVALGDDPPTYNAITMINGILTLIATISIPVVLGIYSHRQSKRDAERQIIQAEHDRDLRDALASREQELMQSQRDILLEQKRILQMTRFDLLVEQINKASTRVSLLRYWDEIQQYEGHFRTELEMIFRRNPQVELPTGYDLPVTFTATQDAVRLNEKITNAVLDQYFYGLPYRFRNQESGTNFTGLIFFLDFAISRGYVMNVHFLAKSITACAENQKASRGTYSDIADCIPGLAAHLIAQIDLSSANEPDDHRFDIFNGACSGWLSIYPKNSKDNLTAYDLQDHDSFLLLLKVWLKRKASVKIGEKANDGGYTVATLFAVLGELVSSGSSVGIKDIYSHLANILKSVTHWGEDTYMRLEITDAFDAFESAYPDEWREVETEVLEAAAPLFETNGSN